MKQTTEKLTAQFTSFTFDSNWVKGTIGQYTFEAKLFDHGSTFGIENGRVSKLSIFDDAIRLQKKDFFASCIVNYDRGWDIKPKKKDKHIYDAVMLLLQESPKRFELQESVN